MPIGKRLWYTIVLAVVPLAIVIVGYIVWVLSGPLFAAPHSAGTLTGLGVNAPVRIMRDARGIPHIRAASAHDAAFAQGYATGSDRLFQIDITRRFVLGTLSDLLGDTTLQTDQDARIVDVRGIVEAQYAHLSPDDRATFVAYADGVNAAAQHEPPAPEYRALFARFSPWRPQDSLAVAYALVLDATDSWYDVIARDNVAREIGTKSTAAFYSLTDPADDVPTVGGRPVVLPPLPAIGGIHAAPKLSWSGENSHDVLGSNTFVAGAAHTSTGRALLANDPHSIRRIPGIWHLVGIEAPGEHIAGAAIAGVPGVILGHNDNIAWGFTYADAVSPRVYRETFETAKGSRYRAGSQFLVATVRREEFNSRFGKAKTRDYLNTRHGFVLEDTGLIRNAVQWQPAVDTRSPVAAFVALDKARTLEDALSALANYPGPTQNFTLAQTDGRVAFTVAGFIPNDPAWGLRSLDGPTTAPSALAFVPFAELPHVAPSRATVAVSANNTPYGAGYKYRLSAAYAAPYRAAEITERLRALPRIDVDSAHAIQADTVSRAERDLARMCATALHAGGTDKDPDVAPAYDALAAFDGKFDPDSRGATVIQRVRAIATRDFIASHLSPATADNYLRNGPAFVTLMRALHEHPRGWFPHDAPAAFLVAEVRATIAAFGGRDAVTTPYGKAYAVNAQHPFGTQGFHLWDGPSMPGSGGSYSPAVQGIALGQSFRAVWDVGNWDAGGIDVPLGESGEPGSAHYTDGSAAWLRHDLTPLPFSAAAVDKATTATLTLAP